MTIKANQKIVIHINTTTPPVTVKLTKPAVNTNKNNPIPSIYAVSKCNGVPICLTGCGHQPCLRSFLSIARRSGDIAGPVVPLDSETVLSMIFSLPVRDSDTLAIAPRSFFLQQQVSSSWAPSKSPMASRGPDCTYYAVSCGRK